MIAAFSYFELLMVKSFRNLNRSTLSLWDEHQTRKNSYRYENHPVIYMGRVSYEFEVSQLYHCCNQMFLISAVAPMCDVGICSSIRCVVTFVANGLNGTRSYSAKITVVQHKRIDGAWLVSRPRSMQQGQATPRPFQCSVTTKMVGWILLVACQDVCCCVFIRKMKVAK